MTQETDLLKRASNEIKQLRRVNELQQARLSGFDDALMLLTSQVRNSGQVMSPDLAWEIDKYISEQSKSPQ